MNGRLTLAASLSLLLVAGTAGAAQPWLEDRRFGEGMGIRVGRFELHPGIATEFGYDSNFFLRAPNEQAGPVQDAWRLRVTPSLTLSNSTGNERERMGGRRGEAPAFNLDARLFAAYSEFFGPREVREQRNVDAGIGAKLDIAPERPFGADVYGDIVRSAEPSNVAGTGQTFNRDTFRGGLGATWRPGGGLFTWRVGYEAAYNYFEDQPYRRDYTNLQHAIITGGRWRILPRSGFLYDARYTFIRYSSTGSPQPNGDILQARLGFAGLLTARIGFLVLGGWSSTFYEATSNAASGKPPTPAQNYDGYIGQAELKFYLQSGPEDEKVTTGLSSVAIGFTRDLSNSYLGAFYTRDRGYVGFDAFLGGVFVANLQGGFARYSYPTIDQWNAGFYQYHADVRLFGEYRLSDVVGLNATFMYDQSIKPGPHDNPGTSRDGVALTDPNAANPVYDNLEYRRFQAYLGVRLFW